MINFVNKYLKNTRGDILQWIIVIIVIGVLAVKTMPGIMNGITSKGNDSVNQITKMDDAFK